MSVMRDEDSLPPAVERAVALLRDEPDIRPGWVDSVVRAAAAQRADDLRPAVAPPWWTRPAFAIAAAIVCMALGSGVTYFAVAPRGAADAVAGAVSPATSARPSAVRFALVAPGAVSVSLVGDFNGWNPTALPMRRSGNGATWEVQVGLAPGRYTYSFVVDGHLARDPAAPETARDDFGGSNSVVLVKGS
jgi:hypothetical protein